MRRPERLRRPHEQRGLTTADDTGGLRKITERDATALLRQHCPDLDVDEVATRPGGVLHRAGSSGYHPAGASSPLAPETHYPELAARHYTGDLVLYRGGCVVHRDVVLPESFRWPYSVALENRSLKVGKRGRTVLRRYARQHQEPVELAGDFFHLDYLNAGHYGHLLTEALPRLWAWPEAKERFPGLQVLLRRNVSRPQRDVGRRDETVLRHLGIGPDDVTWCDRPVRVTSLVGAAPAWHGGEPHFAHPEVRQVWDCVREGVGPGDGRPSPEKVFITRHGGNRECRNVDDVDRFFADRGFDVVDPARLSFEEQVRVVSGARVVAGLGGTGLFNVGWCTRLETVIVLNHSDYWARNEELYARVLGADFHLFLSRPDPLADVAEGRLLPEAASWEFDVERLADELDGVLRGV